MEYVVGALILAVGVFIGILAVGLARAASHEMPKPFKCTCGQPHMRGVHSEDMPCVWTKDQA